MASRRALRRGTLLVPVLAALGACAGLPPTILTRDTTAARGPQFNDELRRGYLELAAARGDASDPEAAARFRAKARDTLDGTLVGPDPVAGGGVPAARQSEVEAARARLTRALDAGGRVRTPAAAAAAQTAFDGWAEALVDGSEADVEGDAAAYRRTFEAALGSVERATLPAAEPVPVYFGTGDAGLDPGDRETLRRAAEAVVARRASSVVVVGHADATGDAARNAVLARSRAEAVADGLRAAGVAVPVTVRSSGESDPAPGATAGVPEAEARRADVLIVR